MKTLLGISLLLFVVSACNKKDKLTGVCYCKFYNGATQEYDLRHLDRQAQMDTCSMHDTNAANFVGSCKLE